ncbi:MAG: hypothetical protein WAL92_17465 [Thiogranum sp.]
MYRFGSLIVLLAAALAGCQTAQHQPAAAPQSVTPDSTFTVVKDFLIPSGDSAVDFQDAGLYPQGRIQPNDPFCRFSTGTSTAGGEVIRKGKFTVSSVEYNEKEAGPGNIDVSVTEIHLREGASGKPYGLDCMLPLLAYGARFVTITEIQGAVGGYMDLQVAP